MPMKLLSADDFRNAVKAGEKPEGTVFRFATAEPETVDGKTRTKRFTFSDATVDHAGDSIDPKGWDLSVFNRNPVALFSHMSWDPPIGRASNVAVVGTALKGDIEFAPPETYAFADTIYRLVDGGYLKAVSVGFLPKTFAFTNDSDRPYGIDFKTQKLLEISVCPVPCNPNALGEARGLLHIDTRPLAEWAEKVLDTGGQSIPVPLAELEALRLQAKGAAAPRFYISASRVAAPMEVEAVREHVKRWTADPAEPLVLPPGFEMRTLGETKAGDWKCGADRGLPLDEEGTWDGAAAEASIFAHAGGDDFDPAVARKGFLAYDASKPKLRGSYKLPFAEVVDGKLTAKASGIRAAASRLPGTDIPDDVKDHARAVIDHYEAQMKKPSDDDKAIETLLLKIDATEVREALAAAIATVKAGRRISAANKALLAKALDHYDAAMTQHTAMSDCIKQVMASDDDADQDAEGSTSPGDANDDSGPHDNGGLPLGTVAPDGDGDNDGDYLSPEQRRLAEVRALRASVED